MSHPTIRFSQGTFILAVLTALFSHSIIGGHVLADDADDVEKGIQREKLRGDGGGKSLAILIGVQEYTSLPPLAYCEADVELLSATLRQHCQFDKVVTLVDSAEDRASRPSLGNISRALRQWLRVANNGDYDRVLVYFSGHGFRGPKGRLYFAPPDCDREALELTALPQTTVRAMLDSCTNVPVKLLVLDCCHSGEGRGDGVGASGSELADVFSDAKGLLTLASCQRDEVSLEWPQKEHGLFTYWLCEGLKGEADSDKDGLVDSGELHKFVYRNVLQSAAEMRRVQTVAYRPSTDWSGIAMLSRVNENAGAKPWFGATFSKFDAEIARKNDVTPGTGSRIYGIFDDSPAEKAGLEVGDIILRIAGNRIVENQDVVDVVLRQLPGDQITFEIIRNRKPLSIKVTLGARPDDHALLDQIRDEAALGRAWGQSQLGDYYRNGWIVDQDWEKAVGWYRKAADQGHAASQHQLGLAYEAGNGVRRDLAQAAQWYSRAAAGGSIDSQHKLGMYYENGHGGLVKDGATALKWYRKAAEAGVIDAQYNYGLLLQKRDNYVDGVRWLRKAAEGYERYANRGNAYSQQMLGFMYLTGQGVAKDYEEAKLWNLKAVDQGNIEAAFRLGWMYEQEKEWREAFRWYRQAAEQDHAASQTNLGWMYERGVGVVKDAKEAFKWYRLAAKNGDDQGMVNLGLAYELGKVTTRDYGEAVYWYQKAANLGNSNGQANLGLMYELGHGVTKSRKDAIKWYYKAALQKDARSQYSLARLSAINPGGTPNYTKSADWVKLSANQDYADAQNLLGWLYETGNGVPKDRTAAIAWYRKAAAQGHQLAKENLKNLGVDP